MHIKTSQAIIRQKNLKRMLKNFEVEYSSVLMIGRDALDEKEIDLFARNSG